MGKILEAVSLMIAPSTLEEELMQEEESEDEDK